jgi:3-oxoadipate enol-lactonase
VDLHVRSAGSGGAGTVLFLHGFPFDGSIWDPQMAALPDGWLGLAPDLRGFGRSPLGADELPSARRLGSGVAFPTEAVLTMDVLADDAAELLRSRDTGPAVVCALSMGGYVAFALLRRHPDLVRALILLDTRPGPDGDEARENRRRMAATARESGAAPVASAMLPQLLSPSTRRERSDVAERLRAMIQGSSPRTIVAALAGMAARRDSTALLGGIRVPTLVIVGAEDAITPPSEARAMAGAIPGARLAIVGGAAHLPGLEQEEVVNARIAEFLAEL